MHFEDPSQQNLPIDNSLAHTVNRSPSLADSMSTNEASNADAIAIEMADLSDKPEPSTTRQRAATFSAPPGRFCCGKLEYGTQPWHILPYHPSVYNENRLQIFYEIVAGLTVAFAQVSESIAFAFIAGVGPLLGLHAGWIVGIILACFASRPGMISGATGVRAAVLRPYVLQYGLSHLFYIVFCISFFQFLLGVFKLAKLVRLVPRPCMIGFVNGLALILLMGQIPQFNQACSYVQSPDILRPLPAGCNVTGTNTTMPATVLLEANEIGLMAIHIVLVFIIVKTAPLVPKVGKYIPASLVGILISTFVEWVIIRPMGGRTPIIGEVGRVSGGLPIPFWLDPQYEGMIAPFNWDTISVCIFPGFIAAGAGAVEAVMTMEEVNDRTGTENESPNQYLFALSLGNAVAALYGTIGGGANIPMSVLALEAGANGRFRISGIVAGVTVFLFVMVAAPLIKIITVSSLIGLMVAVILATMDWGSIWFVVLALLPQSCREHPKWLEYAEKYPDISSKRKIRRVDAIVIVIVWVVTIVQDLFVAVAAGVAVTALAYAWDMGERFTVTSKLVDNGKTIVYTVHGPVFFASTQRFVKMFRFKEDPDNVELHFDRDGSELVDYSALHAINVVSDKYKKEDKTLVVKYLGERAERMLNKADAAFNFSVDTSSARPLTVGDSVPCNEGNRVKTRMGNGTVTETRNNGATTVVSLDWELANSGKATMIVQTENLL